MKFKKGQEVFIYSKSAIDEFPIVKSEILDFASQSYRLPKIGLLYQYRFEKEIFLTEKGAIKACIEYLEEERERQIDFINSNFLELHKVRSKIAYCKSLKNNKAKND